MTDDHMFANWASSSTLIDYKAVVLGHIKFYHTILIVDNTVFCSSAILCKLHNHINFHQKTYDTNLVSINVLTI